MVDTDTDVVVGLALINLTRTGQYEIRLIANQITWDWEWDPRSRRSRIRQVTARQRCTGEVRDGQLHISCRLAERAPYTPDSFVLRRQGSHLVGRVNGSESVTFSPR